MTIIICHATQSLSVDKVSVSNAENEPNDNQTENPTNDYQTPETPLQPSSQFNNALKSTTENLETE
jgi:hypothetical protein